MVISQYYLVDFEWLAGIFIARLEAKQRDPAAHPLQTAVGFSPPDLTAKQTGQMGSPQIRDMLNLIGLQILLSNIIYLNQ
jgi:hypothetical protein